jgi:hypothetical protein
LPETIPLSRLALVHRGEDGTEHDRVDGPMLAGLLCGIRPGDRRMLFDPEDIATHVEGLAALVAAVGADPDTPEHTSSALYVVEQGLRALVPRLDHFAQPDQTPADLYVVEIAPEVTA